jgi:hypothetical protein
MMRTGAAVAAAVAFVPALPALAQADGAWLIVAERPAGADGAPLTIEVARAYVSREIMFCAEGSPVKLLDAQLRFHDGQSQTLQMRSRVRAGGCSRTYALRGHDRQIASVSVTYDPASLGGATAQVQLLAR